MWCTSCRLRWNWQHRIFTKQSTFVFQLQTCASFGTAFTTVQGCRKRTQQVIRSKTIEVVENCANKFVHYNAKDIPEFVNDLLNWKKWKSAFGSCHNKVELESTFLSNLAGEYKRCKDEDLSKAVRLWSAKQTQKILIGQTLREEFLWVGRPQRFSNRTLMQLKILAGFEVTLMKREDFCQLSQQITHIQY